MRDVEIPKWLEGLPLAPEFRPTDTEFADPIAYISKIEKEASAFGICKVIPPLPKPSKKYVLYNLNRTLSKSPELGSDINVKKINDGFEGTNGSEVRAVFTTRHQELGQSGKMVKGAVGSQPIGVPKQVWQSGEVYTMEQFETKSKNFAKSQLGELKEVSPLVVETMFWKAASEKPIYVEYANDVPGSGFSEPEGSFRYFNRRRRRSRKRGTFDRSSQGNSCSENGPVSDSSNIVNNCIVDKNADGTNLHVQQSQVSTSVSSMSAGQSEIFSEGKFSNTSNEMHGTAGRKLSNSSWNLQVIARSPGSLTRYMPDDIPGVTSPMVYIGMLFSWFAWHVEDHELHSLNFLHMGSPKTWYSVPGDFASSFEEVIRDHAYGRGTNLLDALTLLGEKTTLVSPEVIVASGIPCYRLVQNPGEFVVTFPRAYHVGFSHGFNCGEAANFCTPKWLTVAKEAAVRRAAMNYLPMLSHQQLLYLLTMSFVARVPRSLLPGARSSRLRDRQKEEREVAVKKAFIEDILKENRLLTKLLLKNSSYRVVLWNLDLLPGSIKDSELCNITDNIGPRAGEDSLPDKYNIEDLYAQMNLYMDTVTDFYVDDADDLQNDYQVDSGTLPCVACGVLGFPFMAVVQPSEQASRDLLPGSQGLVLQTGISQPLGSESMVLTVWADSIALEHSTVSSAVKLERSWNLSKGCLRPRLFCLEHAIQTVELLHPKGGANVLGICHSDFQKIKAHSAVVAEEISSPFIYNEIPLGTASQEDLYLIDLAIDNEEKEACTQDWTSELNINMQHCVRKNFPSLKVQHALTLDGLFPDAVLSGNAFQWQTRKSRSKRGSNPSILIKSLLSIEPVKVEKAVDRLDGEMYLKQGQATIQYYRKRYKSKPCDLEGVSRMDSDKKHPKGLLGADSNIHRDKKDVDVSDSTRVRVEDTRNFSSGSIHLASCGKSLIPAEENVSTSKPEDSSTCINIEVETVDGRSGNSISEEQVERTRECDITVHDLENFANMHVVEITAENPDPVNFGNSVGSVCISSNGNENSVVTKEKNAVSEMGFENRMETDESGRQCDFQTGGDVFMKNASNDTNSCYDDSPGERINEHTETSGVDTSGLTAELVKCSIANGQVLKQKKPSEGEDEGKGASCDGQFPSEYGHALVVEAQPPRDVLTCKHQHKGCQGSSLPENKQLDDVISTEPQFQLTGKGRSKRRRVDAQNEDPTNLFGSFIRSPCEGLRPRAKSNALGNVTDSKTPIVDKKEARMADKRLDGLVLNKDKQEQNKGSHSCDIEGCQVSFQTKAELVLHMRNRCPVKGCRKKFNSHKYAVVHQRVHDDDRPLKCPWKGCTMTFKWAWARTEHVRVHTGERPYKCKVEGCGLTFRFVSDFSRHRRKTGHCVN